MEAPVSSGFDLPALLNLHHHAIEVPVPSGFDLPVLLNPRHRAIEVPVLSGFDLLRLNASARFRGFVSCKCPFQGVSVCLSY